MTSVEKANSLEINLYDNFLQSASLQGLNFSNIKNLNSLAFRIQYLFNSIIKV